MAMNFPISKAVRHDRAWGSGPQTLTIIQNITERFEAMQASKHVDLERAVSGFSAKFINVAANRVDQDLVCALRILSEALDTDRAVLLRFDAASGDLLVTHAWTRPGFPEWGPRVARQALPWFVECLGQGTVIAVESLDDLPPEASAEQEYARSVGRKSSLTVPLRAAGQIIGGLSIGGFRKQHHWDSIEGEPVAAIDDLNSQQFYHGTKADLERGTSSSPAMTLPTVRGRRRPMFI